VHYRVPVFDTDLMGVVHHANYVRYMELARVVWLDEHDQPYAKYVEQDLHFATTRVELDYHQGARFDDVLTVTVWLDWVRAASIRMACAIADEEGALLASGATEHAVVNGEGRVRRLPRETRDTFLALAVRAHGDPPPAGPAD